MAFGIDDIILYAIIASTAVQVDSSIKANKNSEVAARAEQRTKDRQAYQQRLKLVRERRLAQSELNNTAANTGTMGSSGYMGATASIASQFGGQQGFMSYTAQQSRKSGIYQQKAADNMYVSQLAGSTMQMASAGASIYKDVAAARLDEAARKQLLTPPQGP